MYLRRWRGSEFLSQKAHNLGELHHFFHGQVAILPANMSPTFITVVLYCEEKVFLQCLGSLAIIFFSSKYANMFLQELLVKKERIVWTGQKEIIRSKIVFAFVTSYFRFSIKADAWRTSGAEAA
jgi:hypothetical protein